MRAYIFIGLVVLLFLSGCARQFEKPDEEVTPPEGFCGVSTLGPCSTSDDCATGGCSGQVCQSKSEEPVITTCEFRDCYNAAAYNLECQCVSNNCMWR